MSWPVPGLGFDTRLLSRVVFVIKVLSLMAGISSRLGRRELLDRRENARHHLAFSHHAKEHAWAPRAAPSADGASDLRLPARCHVRMRACSSGNMASRAPSPTACPRSFRCCNLNGNFCMLLGAEATPGRGALPHPRWTG